MEPLSSTYRLVVRSMGTANPGVRRALTAALGLGDGHVAQVLLRAPQELLGGLPRQTADSARDLLRSTGLEVEVLAASEPFTPGTGDLEVALSIPDEAPLPEIVLAVAELLELPLEKAMEVVWRSPCELLGGVSQSAVEAIRRRFEPLGVELDVSRPDEALFDFFVGPCVESVRLSALRVLAEVGASAHEEQPIVAFGLSRSQAATAWESLRRCAAPVRVLNRDFQRFDVRLEQAQDSPALRDFLVSVTGMPERVAGKVLSRLPVVLLGQVPHARAYEVVAAAARLGAQATAELLAFQTFSIVVDEAPDRAIVEAFARSLSPPASGEGQPLSWPLALPGPFTHVQARWTLLRLQKLGAAARRVRA